MQKDAYCSIINWFVKVAYVHQWALKQLFQMMVVRTMFNLKNAYGRLDKNREYKILSTI